ncbi:MAG: DUF551 domain-containing protein [Colwellia sp.]|nr:DUF551 domain-containing protein [Colwellia sp.]
MSEWISVEDALPEECGRYLCYLTEQTSLGQSGFWWNCSYNSYDKRWGGEGLYGGETVTHWMHPPDTPK